MSDWQGGDSSWGDNDTPQPTRKPFKVVKPKTEVQSYALMRRLDKKRRKSDKTFKKDVNVGAKKKPSLAERRINDTTFLSLKGKVIGRMKGKPKNQEEREKKGKGAEKKEKKETKEKKEKRDDNEGGDSIHGRGSHSEELKKEKKKKKKKAFQHEQGL
mmetsp:Transcript_18321/g.30555  ORF Transcript_18321/g.30555 Transcript_18321/m.30555 type:complete len:158 (+) Transcript_18321:92-565(+)